MTERKEPKTVGHPLGAETNERRIKYLESLVKAIDDGDYEIAGNTITFYLPRGKTKEGMEYGQD